MMRRSFEPDPRKDDPPMGKGDKRSKRGKLFRKSYGKSRPKPRKIRQDKAAAAAAASSES
jgi:30S ribosomal protein S31